VQYADIRPCTRDVRPAADLDLRKGHSAGDWNVFRFYNAMAP